MSDRSLKVAALRRRVARWVDPGLEAELRETRRRLKATRRRLRQAEGELRRSERPAPAAPVDALPEPVEHAIDRVRAERLTYVKADGLRELAAAVVALERDGVPGTIVEAGVARGGSAIVLAAAKAPERPLKLFDVFGMIPPPTEQDGPDVHRRYETIRSGQAAGPGGETYYGYRDDLLQEVRDAFTRHGFAPESHSVDLVQGLFEDTIHLDGPVALAHLDGDWYESTRTCLTRIAPLLAPGGRLVIDDYYKWSGCRTAVDEYLAEPRGLRVEHRSKLHLVRD